MKIRIETDDKISEPEVIIRCRDIDGEAVKVQTAILDALSKNRKLALLKDGKEYYLSPEAVLFFEAVDGKTFAHTPSDIFESKQKLYELEDSLPSSFVRAGKSVVLGTKYILAITRNLTGPSTVQFRSSHKQVNVSRSYFKQLKDKLNERV
ncbi:MAG: LytTR family transcriptional regulator [Candidatus Nomurabacteria bacterium]|jgi:DNA-binding LytR/AlgR family response regulator|nr:LytTR family transcriptional regulator [Candidatus Nomurabacteria bacterium]